jgi:hypothetical protein
LRGWAAAGVWGIRGPGGWLSGTRGGESAVQKRGWGQAQKQTFGIYEDWIGCGDKGACRVSPACPLLLLSRDPFGSIMYSR